MQKSYEQQHIEVEPSLRGTMYWLLRDAERIYMAREMSPTWRWLII